MSEIISPTAADVDAVTKPNSSKVKTTAEDMKGMPLRFPGRIVNIGMKTTNELTRDRIFLLTMDGWVPVLSETLRAEAVQPFTVAKTQIGEEPALEEALYLSFEDPRAVTAIEDKAKEGLNTEGMSARRFCLLAVFPETVTPEMAATLARSVIRDRFLQADKFNGPVILEFSDGEWEW